MLTPPVGYQPQTLVRALSSGHPLLQERWPRLEAVLTKIVKMPFIVGEVYRYDVRQQWLWAQGRSREQCRAAGVPEAYARAGAIVTNASSARLSAHGCTITRPDGIVVPAAAALDIWVLGADGKPWTKDDPWDDFITIVAALAPTHGLRHFSKPGKSPWDKPHIQLLEWSDATHSLNLT